MEDRIIELETIAAYQSERISKLEEVASQQQLELHQLRKEIQAVRKQLIEVVPSLVDDLDDQQPPPHY